MANIIAETNAEDHRILQLLETNHRKIAKPPSDTRIGDARTGGEIQIGERVALGKDRIDTAEAEVASLWDQWESAQKKVDAIFAEFAGAPGVKGVQTGSMTDVQQSLAGEMAKFGEELTGILEGAHEEARVSEKVGVSCSSFSIDADLVSCLELRQENQRHHVKHAAGIFAGGLRDWTDLFFPVLCKGLARISALAFDLEHPKVFGLESCFFCVAESSSSGKGLGVVICDTLLT